MLSSRSSKNTCSSSGKSMLVPTCRGRQVAGRTARTARARKGLQQGRDGAGCGQTERQCNAQRTAAQSVRQGTARPTLLPQHFTASRPLQAGGRYTAYSPHTWRPVKAAATALVLLVVLRGALKPVVPLIVPPAAATATAAVVWSILRRACSAMERSCSVSAAGHQHQRASSEAECSVEMAGAPAVHQNCLVERSELVPLPATAVLPAQVSSSTRCSPQHAHHCWCPVRPRSSPRCSAHPPSHAGDSSRWGQQPLPQAPVTRAPHIVTCPSLSPASAALPPPA
jgi:hypothetical protein